MPTISMFYGIIISMFFAIKEVENGTVTRPSSLYTSVTKPVIPAGIAGIQTTWTYLSLPSMALDTRFPAGMTNYLRICV
jgi:hypothetical protein